MDPTAYTTPTAEMVSDTNHETKESNLQQPSQSADTRPAKRLPAIFGALLAIVAWVLLFWTGFGSFCTAAASLLVSIFGIRGRLRNLAITSIVAASVLMLVFAIFEGMIFIMLRAV